MKSGSVLLLNLNYEPLNVCSLRRALVMVLGGKAEILENGRGFIHSVNRAWPVPSVVRLGYMIHRPLPRVRLCRKEVFRRDDYTCQYCGRRTRNLTMDHVNPRHRGGMYAWDNLVSACPACNRRKGGKTVEQARMKLRHQPQEPRPTGTYLFQSYLDENQEWQKYLQGWWE
jgi:5-methylcytosine-specific restriction endonuclease McrA